MNQHVPIANMEATAQHLTGRAVRGVGVKGYGGTRELASMAYPGVMRR